MIKKISDRNDTAHYIMGMEYGPECLDQRHYAGKL